MLNEKLEYYEYTCDLNDSENVRRRIKYATLSRGDAEFNGLERFLTIIARHFLYYHNNGFASKDDIDAAYAALLSWLGYDKHDEKTINNERNKEIETICGWFPKYIKDVMLRQKIEIIKNENKGENERIDALLEKLINEENAKELLETSNTLKGVIKEAWDRKKDGGTSEDNICKIAERYMILSDTSFKRKIASTSAFWGTNHDINDYKMASLEKVIANALCRKRLNVFYLVCKDPHFTEAVKRDRKKTVTEKREDTLLKIVAAYLVENFYSDPGTSGIVRYVPFNKVTVSNWYMNDGYLKNEYFDNYKYKGRDLFYIQLLGRNQLKISIDPEWFELCEWALIPATDNDDNLIRFLNTHPGYRFYRDDGACKPLVENEVYDRNPVGSLIQGICEKACLPEPKPNNNYEICHEKRKLLT